MLLAVIYLRIPKDAVEAVEELQGPNHVALHQHGRGHRRGRPVARADRHLVVPCFQREATDVPSSSSSSASELSCHISGVVVVRSRVSEEREAVGFKVEEYSILELRVGGRYS